MKIYVTADIEGITGITHWDETIKGNPSYQEFQKQMTKEVTAACKAALEVGAKEILVKDAHGMTASNIIASELPNEVKLSRGWSWHPFFMVDGLDETFDAVFMIGMHSGAGSDQNPLSHTISTRFSYVKINEKFASEFLLYTYAAALVDVPVIFVSGDNGICKEVSSLNNNIQTVSVSEGVGSSTISINPNLTLKKIKLGVKTALNKNFALSKVMLPKKFIMQIKYKNHRDAYRASFYPGAELIEPKKISFKTKDYFEILRMLSFIMGL